VTALGDLPVHAGVNDDDAKLDAAEKDVDPGTGKRRIRKGTRVLAISAKLFEKLLAQRPVRACVEIKFQAPNAIDAILSP